MAFDQISLFLYPPRWDRYSVAHPQLLHISGEAVQVVSDMRTDRDGPMVRLAEIGHWFEAKGFGRSPDYANFHSAAIPSALGPRVEIDVMACNEGGEDDEVTSLYCRFLLTRDSPVKLERWEAFMHELCGTFGLRIGVADGKFVGSNEFLNIVKNTDTWQCFANHFGWGISAKGDPP